MRFTRMTGLAVFVVFIGCEASRVDRESPETPPSADSPAQSEETPEDRSDDVAEPDGELDRADLLSQVRARELATSVVLDREGWPAARCIPRRKQGGWSVLVWRDPRERFADDVIVEVSREGKVTGYRYAR